MRTNFYFHKKYQKNLRSKSVGYGYNARPNINIYNINNKFNLSSQILIFFNLSKKTLWFFFDSNNNNNNKIIIIIIIIIILLLLILHFKSNLWMFFNIDNNFFQIY